MPLHHTYVSVNPTSMAPTVRVVRVSSNRFCLRVCYLVAILFRGFFRLHATFAIMLLFCGVVSLVDGEEHLPSSTGSAEPPTPPVPPRLPDTYVFRVLFATAIHDVVKFESDFVNYMVSICHFA
jgi:hypothetical protein